MVEWFFAIGILCALGLALWVEIGQQRSGVVSWPTMGSTRQVMIAMLRERLGDAAGQELVDLGSGWGGLARRMARTFPAADVTGYEMSGAPYYWSRIVQTIRPLPNLTFRKQSFFEADMTRVTGIAAYIPSPMLEKLRPKLEAELPEGAVFVSTTFQFTAWTAEAERPVPRLWKVTVYRYRVPASNGRQSTQ